MNRSVVVAMTALILFTFGLVAHSEITVESPLGEVVVSCSVADLRDYGGEGNRDGLYVTRKYGFVISYPSGSGWELIDSPKIPEMHYEVPVFILSTQVIDGFRAHISVFVARLQDDMPISAYMDTSMLYLKNSGRTIVASRTDDATSSGYIESIGSEQGKEISTIQRLGIRNRTAYIVTANMLPGDATSAKTKKDLGDILNSFKFLR
ncbi:MAG: hypothetical protein HY914_19000 [Desulfomonile tiedjei]|nr:hypothetical protein [Desulfomonile tiedjei]